MRPMWAHSHHWRSRPHCLCDALIAICFALMTDKSILSQKKPKKIAPPFTCTWRGGVASTSAPGGQNAVAATPTPSMHRPSAGGCVSVRSRPRALLSLSLSLFYLSICFSASLSLSLSSSSLFFSLALALSVSFSVCLSLSCASCGGLSIDIARALSGFQKNHTTENRGKNSSTAMSFLLKIAVQHYILCRSLCRTLTDCSHTVPSGSAASIGMSSSLLRIPPGEAGCSCFRFESMFNCGTCDLKWEDHETCFATTSQRSKVRLPVGNEFLPLAGAPQLQTAVFGEVGGQVSLEAQLEAGKITTQQYFAMIKDAPQAVPSTGAGLGMKARTARSGKKQDLSRPERSVALSHVTSGGRKTGPVLNRYGKARS